jgi:hypothetical protein
MVLHAVLVVFTIVFVVGAVIVATRNGRRR